MQCFFKRKTEILIRPCGYTDWFESSLYVHENLYLMLASVTLILLIHRTFPRQAVGTINSKQLSHSAKYMVFPAKAKIKL